MQAEQCNRFIQTNREKAEFNQYWYSPDTIEKMVNAIQNCCSKRVAFLSTPSIYFSLTDPELKEASVLFDLDEGLKRKANWCSYDYNLPTEIDQKHHHQFDCVVIDPPFISAEVWRQYAISANLLLQKSPSTRNIVLTTIAENEALLSELLKVAPVTFRPSIPNLVYQYEIFTNFDSEILNERNMLIPEEG